MSSYKDLLGKVFGSVKGFLVGYLAGVSRYVSTSMDLMILMSGHNTVNARRICLFSFVGG